MHAVDKYEESSGGRQFVHLSRGISDLCSTEGEELTKYEMIRFLNFSKMNLSLKAHHARKC